MLISTKMETEKMPLMKSMPEHVYGRYVDVSEEARQAVKALSENEAMEDIQYKFHRGEI